MKTLDPICDTLESTSAASRDGWRWEVPRGLSAVNRLYAPWNDLAHAGSLSPTADAIWTRCFWGAFGDAEENLALHCLYEGDRLIAVLPLRRCGRIVRAWAPAMNVRHTPYWVFAMAEDRPAAGEILDHLLDSADLVDFKRLPSSGPLREALLEAGLSRRVFLWEDASGGDAVIDLSAPWESFLKRFPKKLIDNTRRRFRNLEKCGSIEFQVVNGDEPLDWILYECLSLEAMGWKSQHG
ncbi:MAG: GNAT family N-acetyltransferase, partial [Planctomycetota bacterium]